MKRIAAIAMLAAVLLTGCGKKTETVSPSVNTEQTQETQIAEAETQAVYPPEETQSPEPAYPGVYRQNWQEEIGGTVIDLNAYIVLNEDATGSWIAQDIGALTWDESRISLTIGVSYDIALTREDGTVKLLVYEFQDENGEFIPTVFEKIDELPADVGELLERG